MDKEAVGMEREAIERAVREAGGIVHRDGNIFFTDYRQMKAAIALAQQPAAQAVGLTPEELTELAEPFWLKDAQKPGEFFDAAGFASALLSRAAPSGEAVQSGTKLWLWENGDHYIAYRHLYPCYTPGGDPMTFGEPSGWAEFRESHDRDDAAPQPSAQQAEQPAEEARGDCAACGGTGDVSGEYPGVACSACGGSGRALLAASAGEARAVELLHKARSVMALAALTQIRDGEKVYAEVSAFLDAAPAAAEAQDENDRIRKWRKYGDDMHQRAMKAERELAELQAAHSRQAQGGALSDEEILGIWLNGGHNNYLAFARAILARAASEPRAEGREAVAVVESWTNGSYTRNYRLRWLREVDAGTTLYAALAAQKKGA